MSARIVTRLRRRRGYGHDYFVELVLTPDEAEEVAYGFGSQDGAFKEIMDLVEECRKLAEEEG